MSKIYKTYEEFQSDLARLWSRKPDTIVTWEARQPEIDQLKQRILELEYLPRHLLAIPKDIYYGEGNYRIAWELRQMAGKLLSDKETSK